jgi:uncharacterized protein
MLLYVIAVGLFYMNGIVSLSTLNSKYLFLFPFGIVVSIVAMSSGISGSNFWVPLNVIVLNLEPRTSFWLALFTMLFGFGSGVIRHFLQDTINAKYVGRFFMLSAPGAIIGAILLPYIKTSLLLIAFGVFVALYGLRMLFVKNSFLGNNEKATLAISFIGGMLKGMIATGLGKLLLPRLINHKGISHPEAVGTAVAVVFFTNIVAVLSLLSNKDFHASLINNWEQLFSIMVFVTPAVIIGGQVGPRIPKLITKELLVKYVGSLLICISYFMIMRGFALL